MNFLSNVLREDGGFDYKKTIVDSILILIRELPDAKESGLSHLCEFIEVFSCQPPKLCSLCAGSYAFEQTELGRAVNPQKLRSRRPAKQRSGSQAEEAENSSSS